MWPHLTDGQASLPAEVVEGAPLQQSCADDVSVTVDGIYDLDNLDYSLNDPPDYADGARIVIYYTVTNASCSDVTVTAALTGSVTGATIHDADGSSAPCADGCNIPAGSPKYGTVQWDLSKHPNATGEKVVATITIDAPSDFNDTDTSNNSATSAQAINIVNEKPAPDIAVKSLTASKTTAVVGETVDFDVTVQNEGDANADADTTVTLHLGADTPELDSDTVSALAVDGEGTVTLSWDTDGAAAGEHSVRALAQTEGDGNADNDSKSVTVTLVEPFVDVAVKSVTPAATEAAVGDTVEFTVALENGGNVPAVTPAVSLFDADGAEDAEALETVTANTIPVGDTKTVTVSWHTDEAEAGTYTLRAVATVADDDDSSNDSATASLTLHDPVDVALSFTSPVASSAVGGTSVSVPFTVTNSGENDTGGVVVNLYVAEVGQDQEDEGEGEEEANPTDTATVATLAVDESTSDTLTWDTAAVAVGDYELEVVAETAGDIDETNNSVSASIEIRNWLLLNNVSPTSAEAVTGDTVEFTAQVENVGTGELTDVTVGLFQTNAQDALVSTSIASIASGSAGTATLAWDTTGRDVEALDLIVAAGASGQDLDRDDSQFVSLEIRNPIALSSATLASADNVAGDSVSINVEVLNESNAEITDVAVDLYVGDSEEAISTETIETVAAGGTADATLTWDTGDAETGERQLRVVVSSPDHNADSNDTATLNVMLRAPVVAVALTQATINRDVAAVGQTLNVVATITNHGEVPETVPVSLYLVEQLQQTTAVSTETSSPVEPGASSEVTLQWDSTDTVVGTHVLKIAAELPGDTTTEDNEQIFEVELFPSAFDGVDGVDTCIEDVGVRVTAVRDRSDQSRSPPDYYVGEKLKATYSVYNFSCQTDLTLVLTMNGPEGHAISDPDTLCFSRCFVPFGGKSENTIEWTIPTLPALNDQPIAAAVSVASPSDFVDANEANNSYESTDGINIVHPGDVVLRLRDQTGGKVSTGAELIGPEFGAVDVRLVSADPGETTLPFATDTLDVVVEAANDGTTVEPVSVQFVSSPENGTNPRELHRHTMVIPDGQSKTETIDVPLNGVLPGVHTIEALLSAAVDQSPDNNAASFEITLIAPLVNVEMGDVVVAPGLLILGDDATLSLTVRNQSEIALPLSLELYVDDDTEPIGTETIDELAPDGGSDEQIAWRVPASPRKLGPHTLKIVASSGDFGVIATADAEVTFHIDAEIVGINTTPADTAMQGEEVAVVVEVQNNGPATVNVPITLHFPSETKDPETRRPPVPSGSTEKTHFTWKTRNYAVSEHTLIATVPGDHNITEGETSAEIPFQLNPLTITATIVDVVVYPESPSVGEPVSIAVTVHNDGSVAVNIPITLRFPPGGRQPQTKQPLVAPKQTGTAVFEWLTSRYAAGTHQFLTEIAAVNSPQRHFTVDLLPTVENVVIVGMGAYPADTAMVGEPVEVWIDVRNDGPLAINVPVRLTFPSAAKQPEVRSPRVGPGETVRVWFEWKTSNYEPGVHTLSAAILLNNNITLGQTTEGIRFALTPLIINATIVDIAVSPEAPRVGEPATITVTVRNDGRIAANIPVTLHFPPGGRQPEPRSPRVDVGDMGEAVFTWRTGHYEPGMHDFRVEVASDPPASQRFVVELLPPIVDVAIVGMGSDPRETAVKGQAVKIWVDVINNGPSALSVPVQLEFPSDRKLPEQKSATIEPGETGRVEFTWKTTNYDAGVHNLTATLLAEHNITELDTTATIQIRLVPAQLIASIADISWSPESPVVGEPVSITVTVRNSGLVAANVPVTLYFPSADKQPETKRPRVAPGAVGSASFTWRTSRHEPGDHLFRVQIPGVAGAVRTFEIELRPPEVDFAVVDFKTPDPLHPIVKGDWVEITVAVQNRGPYAGRGTVYLMNAVDLDTMYHQSVSLEPDEPREVLFTWKTLRYPVGEYELLVRVDAEHDTDADNNTSETALVRLLTDRDITVGFGNSVRPAVFAEPTAATSLKVFPQYPQEILVASHGQRPGDRLISPTSISTMGVAPQPRDGDHDPAGIYWQWRSAQASPWECARYQRTVGESLPRMIACPRAPALVR